MEVTPLSLPGVLRIEPRRFPDDRGAFWECWHEDRYREAGISGPFVQDNAALSTQGVLRGLHYQWPNPQGKLVHVLQGRVFDVAVDLRKGSATFGRWVGEILDGEAGTQLWIPEGFAHGYAVLTETAVLSYKCTRPFDAGADRAVRWDDPEIGIEWPVTDPLLSEKDRRAPLLREVGEGALPEWDP